jgi:hypothetical protein
MSTQREAHVVPAERGGWDVRIESSVVSHHVRKRDAVVSARGTLRNRGGGEAVIHSPSGRISAKDTIAPSPTSGAVK